MKAARKIKEVKEEIKKLEDSIGSIGTLLADMGKMITMLEADRTRASLDDLTGLLRRDCFNENLATMLASIEKTSADVCLIAIDIDDFKNINDTFGHPVGDKVLKAVAEAIFSSVSEYDIIGRFGGEEFVVATTGNIGHALTLSERIRATVADLSSSISISGLSDVTVSVGVASLRSYMFNVERTYETADRALYDAKQSGKNCVRLAG